MDRHRRILNISDFQVVETCYFGNFIFLLFNLSDILKYKVSNSFKLCQTPPNHTCSRAEIQGGGNFPNHRAPPKFWVLLHFYVTISKFSPILASLRGGECGDSKDTEGGNHPLFPPCGHVCFQTNPKLSKLIQTNNLLRTIYHQWKLLSKAFWTVFNDIPFTIFRVIVILICT